MIFATYYWRLELARLARLLRRHMRQRRWRAASDASVEKCVMLGCYAVRKMLHAFQPPPNMPTDVPLTTFPHNGKKLSRIVWPSVEDAFDLAKPGGERISLRELSNQVIHSHFFSLWLGPDRALRGIFFCSDRNKDRKVYRLHMVALVTLFEQIASSRRRAASLAHLYPDHNRVTM